MIELLLLAAKKAAASSFPTLPGVIAKYLFQGGLTTDSSGNGYTLVQNNSPTNPSGIIGTALSTVYTGANNNTGGTSEGATSHYMRYTATNMGITDTSTVVFNLLVNVLVAPSSGDRYCFISKQVPGTAYLILYENNSGVLRVRFIRNRDYAGTDSINYNVTLVVGQVYMIGMKYVGTTLTAYINGVPVGTLTSSGVGATTTYTGLRIGETSNNFGGSKSNHLTDEVFLANADWSTTVMQQLWTAYVSAYGTLASVVTDSRPGGSFATFATTAKQGEAITTTKSLRIVSVEKNASCNATTCYIGLGNSYSGIVLATATFVGNTATFNLDLAPGTYSVYQDSGGSSYNSRYFNTSYPQNRTNFNYIEAIGGNTTQWLNIENIITQDMTR